MSKVKSVYIYTSVCCNVIAKKPPCEWSKEDRKENKFSQSSLGHWSCQKCKKGCKVKRSENKEEHGKSS